MCLIHATHFNLCQYLKQPISQECSVTDSYEDFLFQNTSIGPNGTNLQSGDCLDWRKLTGKTAEKLVRERLLEGEVICVKVYNDILLVAQHKDNKDVDNDALIKYNKNDGDLVDIDDTSNLEGDIGKPPKRDTKVVMEELRVTTSKSRDQPTYQDDTNHVWLQ